MGIALEKTYNNPLKVEFLNPIVRSYNLFSGAHSVGAKCLFFLCEAFLSHKKLVGRFHSSKTHGRILYFRKPWLGQQQNHHLDENHHQGVSQEPLRFYEEVIQPLGPATCSNNQNCFILLSETIGKRDRCFLGIGI